MIFLGNPYLQIISFLMNLTTTSLVTLAYEAASTHLVKYSMATKMKWCSFEALGSIALIMFMPYIENGHNADNTFNGTSGALTFSAKV